MHLCADEFVAISTALTAALPFLPRVKAFFKRLFTRKPKVAKAPDCTCRKCQPCRCASCTPVSKEELENWLTNVMPVLRSGDLDSHLLKDGSGYLVNGRIYPIWPTPPTAEYRRGPQGWERAP